MYFETLFFDLDATLYPESNGLWPAIRRNINRYMSEKLNIPIRQIASLRELYYLQYGTTLRGLQIHYGIDSKDYLNFVHDLPLHKYLQPDPVLHEMLLSIPRSRWIFTNSDRDHAERVIRILGIDDCFDGMVDIYALEPYCKPKREAYQLAIKLSGTTDPKNCVLLDDSIINLAEAKKMGFFTVLVGQNNADHSADRTIQNIINLPDVVPEIWE